MDDFKYDGREIKFIRLSGEVLDTDKYSETQVYSTVTGGGASVPVSTTHSRSIINHEFWIKTENGTEESIKLLGRDIPLRQGQKITLIYATKNNLDRSWLSILVNHNAGKYWYISDADYLIRFFKLRYRTGISFFIDCVVVSSIMWLAASLSGFGNEYVDHSALGLVIGSGVGVGYLIIRFVSKSIKEANLTKEFKRHLDNLAQQEFHNVNK